MESPITTIDVCAALNLTEPALRHLLRRPGAPRPALHPSARVFLWTEADVESLRAFCSGDSADDASLEPSMAQASPAEEGGA